MLREFFYVSEGFFYFSNTEIKRLMTLVSYYQRNITIIEVHQKSLFHGVLRQFSLLTFSLEFKVEFSLGTPLLFSFLLLTSFWSFTF